GFHVSRFTFLRKMKFKSAWTVLKEAVNGFNQDAALRLSAATAYYAVFSIGPLLVLVIGLAGLAFGEDRVAHEVGRQVRSYVGTNSAALVESMMKAQHADDGNKPEAQHTGDEAQATAVKTQHTRASLMATIIGAVALISGAGGFFGQLQDSLNVIWGVTTKPGKNFWAYIRDRFFSMAMVLGIGFLLLISMALSAFVNAMADRIADMVSIPKWVAPGFHGLVSFGVSTLLFASIFKILPDVRIKWRNVWAGALGTAFLFAIGKEAMGWYIGRQTSASAYGAGSAFIVVLLYIYYSSAILYFGAEFTEAYAKYRGSRIQPSRYAVLLTDEQRAQQGMPTQEQIDQAERRSEPPEEQRKAA
ncbi:MAG: hypothetical protein C5B50_05800, partial [Verrucomicrobia bacterium]